MSRAADSGRFVVPVHCWSGAGASIPPSPRRGHLRVAQGTLRPSLTAVGRGQRVERLAAVVPATAARHPLRIDPFIQPGLKSTAAGESETGATLTALSPASVTAGEGTVRVVVSPDGKNVYATNREAVPGTISEYSRNAETGVLTPLATVAAGEEPEGVVVSPDGKNVYVPDRFSNTVSQYSRNTTTGVLKALSPATVEAGSGPIGIAISQTAKASMRRIRGQKRCRSTRETPKQGRSACPPPR